jgi:glycosyltransferase involved in cell wall biosynthesis
MEILMRPLVTVVMPVYNKEEYVSRAIQSVLDQTYPELELLCVDDASKDGSMERVAEFDDPRIRVLRRTTSGPGGYAARNHGIRHAMGDWVTFLDADDSWFPEHLAQAMTMADEFVDIPMICAARISQVGTKQSLDPFAEHFISQGPQILTLSDYLKFACRGWRAVGTNAVLLKRNVLFSYTVFPEGRTERSGDLYAWVELLARMQRMVWSPHIASISYRDAASVSVNATPSIDLFREMVNDLGPYVSHKDEKWLKRYSNKMVKYAWLQKKKKRVALPLSLLPGSFYWANDIPYCLKWTLISLMPFGALESMHRRFFAD